MTVTGLRAVGIVVPAHDEEAHLPAALAAIERACGRLLDDRRDAPAPAVKVVVALDACSDASSDIARDWCARRDAHGCGQRAVVEVQEANVGAARRAGVDLLLDGWSTLDPGGVWLATTDADSVVPPNWLVRQVLHRARGAQLWTGVVEVVDWSDRHPDTERAWRRQYGAEAAPVHGASFGLSAEAYLRAGGWAPLPTGEDRALHAAVRAAGGRAAHDRAAPVVTSGRRAARAPAGFAAALSRLERSPSAAGLGG